MKILIVEDGPKTAAFVKRGFTQESFVADVAADGADGLHLARMEESFARVTRFSADISDE